METKETRESNAGEGQSNPSTQLGERFPKSTEELGRLRALGVEAARDLCGFVDRSPTPWHATAEVAARLRAAGFTELSERDAWALAPGDRRFVIRGGSSIVAFVAGQEHPAVGGFRLVGAHTDSPNLRVKPNGDYSKSGYQQVGIEVYGGVLYSTWLDRDLSIAGRVMLRRKDGTLEARLLNLLRPVARVPNLAIHLNRGVNSEGLVLNAQKHLAPILGLGKESELSALVARELDVPSDAIAGFDLCLYDVAPSTIGGVRDELIFAPRLDNLASCHTATQALLAVAGQPASATRGIVLYDHEEVGSRSAVGAVGPLLRDTLTRIVEAWTGREEVQGLRRALAGSLLVSADMAHAVHPNYADQHEPRHAPQLNRGLVIKSNANQAYATDGATAASFVGFCGDVGFAPQRFVVRSDLPCGSTIGPITAAELGIATVDVGAPMLSMHSCREMAGTLDVHLAIETYRRALG
ncbi:M18 family aminopeptidase [Chondromyces crocatus]|nr:M18 family aminopeptidase [Chondromyces crocatus]